MNPERDDPILDACLDEVLGGRKAPDLTVRDFEGAGRATASSRAIPRGAAKRAGGHSPPRSAAAQDEPEANLAMAGGCRHRRRPGHCAWDCRHSALAARRAEQPGRHQGSARQGRGTAAGGSGQWPAGHLPSVVTIASSRAVASCRGPIRGPRSFRCRSPADKGTDETPAAAANSDRQRHGHQPLPDEELVCSSTRKFSVSWAEANVKPASPAKDEEWCRRVFLVLLGRIPSNEEVTAYVEDIRHPKAALVDRLLGDEYAAAVRAELGQRVDQRA